jgi:hypothetical protein
MGQLKLQNFGVNFYLFIYFKKLEAFGFVPNPCGRCLHNKMNLNALISHINREYTKANVTRGKF